MLNWLKSLTTLKAKLTENNVNTNGISQLFKDGMLLHENGKDAEAVTILKKILAIDPLHFDALYLNAKIVNKHGDSHQAIALIKRAISINKNDPVLYRFLGDLYIILNNFHDAAEYFQQALEIEPYHIPTLLALGASFEHSRQFKRAEEIFSQVIEREPSNFDAYTKLGEVYLDCGKTELAIAKFKKAHELVPFNPDIYSSYLFATNYSTKLSVSAIFNAHKKFDQLYALQPNSYFQALENTDPNKKLRIGYISPDFRKHSVSRFFEPLLELHDRSAFEIVCYHLHHSKDEVSIRLKDKSDFWTDCSALSDDELFAKIQVDKIDIIVDLAGHTTGSRLLVLSRKPAPIQMTWLGYINTTGLKAIDYRIVDGFSDPPSVSEKYHSEQLLRLPGSQ